MRSMRSKNSRFARGTGVFACRSCSRKTRATGGDNHSVGLCEECYDIAGQENALSDNGSEWTPEQIAQCKADIAQLTTQCIAKGGKLTAPIDLNRTASAMSNLREPYEKW